MFPHVNKRSFSALTRLCYGKNVNRTKIFIDNIWDRAAINEMMRVSSTPDFDSLINWLISPSLDKKIITINNYYSY